MNSVKQASSLRIVAPAHLHIGNPDLSGDYGRLYGTLGFAIEEPKLILEASIGKRKCDCERRDARKLFVILSQEYKCNLSMHIEKEIPRHVGLGSTTPLYLAINQAFEILCNGNYNVDVKKIALKLGRGTISALGVYSYMYGGFLYDGGFTISRKGRMIPPLVFRTEVPKDIAIIVVVPEKPIKKIIKLKEKEAEILERLPRMDPHFADKLSRIILMGILPYLLEKNWEEAGRNITRFNRLLGEYWSIEQGGVYCCPEVEEIIDVMLSQKALFAAQSSWGPTAYGAYPLSRARHVYQFVKRKLEELGGGRIWITSVANSGARVSVYG
jgi:beta-ribofuranosylaminobenzene 5'-phosphate synthase